MKIQQSEALTLRTYPYAESHKIGVFLTKDYGKVRGVAYGAKKPRNRYGSALEPLTHIRLTFSQKEHRELAVIKSCEILQACSAQPPTWEISLYLSYFAELLNEFSKEQEESEKLMRLALAVIEASRKASIDLVARYLELWLLKLEGVLPRLEGKLSPELAAKSEALLRRHPLQLTDVSLTPEEGRKLEALCSQLIEYHLEKRLKAKTMLKHL